MFTKTKPVRESLPNPCVHNCCLDEQDVCLGCHRTFDEILHWHEASVAEQREILKRSEERAEHAFSYHKQTR
ncbi:DUF1289 domain-containing protein [Vibrio porteresiae]|uniref:DUF1289 domain-containing protein n=1 Tax=Vibrio porteresiae DSM 19223 TaxID=1123496 RepID=A0ABZ0QH00_9VIBR|nr:DUF1289 domain-containing protein [Vibrio porteresiae]WPC75777.1 DUF1289 domain-containing protein [Vibrio porteresiae DSM 19223]